MPPPQGSYSHSDIPQVRCQNTVRAPVRGRVVRARLHSSSRLRRLKGFRSLTPRIMLHRFESEVGSKCCRRQAGAGPYAAHLISVRTLFRFAVLQRTDRLLVRHIIVGPGPRCVRHIRVCHIQRLQSTGLPTCSPTLRALGECFSTSVPGA